ncbi:testis-expressed protein 264 [Candoia aspera]|uniref:testis-expressed protein 264 n=1 Tax=Candoia aspera TaxID=51853 RepID=UPI002FD8293E
MSDWLLIGLFVALVALLLLTLFGFAVYSGLFTEVIVSAGLPPIGNITVAYKFQVGPYGDSGRLFMDSCSVSPRLSSIAVYYDNPHTVDPEKCRYAVGSVLSEGEDKPSEKVINTFLKYGFKIINFPAPSHVVMATFPYTTPLSIHLAVNRVHSSLDVYIKERKLCAHPRLEIYKGDKIYFICPLARQGDFYVPEMKELEKKNRAAAAAIETDDDQTDITGMDTMSETSSVSLEATTDISETSVATSILSPFVSGHSREEADNHSEHSYSGSGASGSSFEELDMEGHGDGDGMAGLSCDLGSAEDQDTTQVKWTKEPIAPEEKRGEE